GVSMLRAPLSLILLSALSGCSVIAVADAAVTVAATAVSAGATVVGTAVDVTAAGVRAATGTGEKAEQGGQGDQAPQSAQP
ncbi:MAG TPA: hypothetical protein VEQ09_00350, partial [Aquabacterium sp.]|nr:hypothetical protein [Aquabacterium sp.]